MSFNEIYADAGESLLDVGGFKASMQKLALVENFLLLSGESQAREVLSHDGALEGLERIISEAVCEYFHIASKAETEMEKQVQAEEEG